MSSDARDATFERFVKLLQSLTQLVVTSKRALNIVCATLQAIVFEETGQIPAYKDWKQICKLGHFNWFVMMGLFTLDATTEGKVDVNNWHVQQIIAAYPECFSFEKSDVRIPLSTWKQEFKKRMADNYQGSRLAYEIADGWDLPISPLSLTPESAARDEQLLAPDNVYRDAQFGDIIEWNGKKFFVAYNFGDEYRLVPAECVDMTV